VIQRLDFEDKLGNPAVAITWSTEGVFKHPGETFDAGSGYFIDPEHVVTAGHVPRMVADEAGRHGVTFRKGIPRHYMQVHDPRMDLHWFVYSVAELAHGEVAAEFTILSVAPVFLEQEAVERYAKWRSEFAYRPLRTSQLVPGEQVFMRGFTDITGDLVGEGAKTHIEINGTTCYCEGVVRELCPDGFLQIKTPCVIVSGGQMPGNTSGGPVVDVKNKLVGVISASGTHAEETAISDWFSIIGPAPDEPKMTGLQVGDIALRFLVTG
jgi:hypothetical protein